MFKLLIFLVFQNKAYGCRFSLEAYILPMNATTNVFIEKNEKISFVLLQSI